MDFEDSVTQTQIEPIEDEGLLYSRSEGMNDGPPDEEHWGKLICNTDDEETTNLDTGTLPGPCVLYLKRKESNASKASALSEIMLGRSSSCEIVINDKRISSQHCRLYYVPSVAGGQQLGTFDVFVEDISSNGTWINTYTHLSKRKVGRIGPSPPPSISFHAILCKNLTDFFLSEKAERTTALFR